MSYLAYLKFIPLLFQLVDFIRQAQAAFKEQGSGPQRLQWVVEHFTPIVSMGAATGLLPQKLADAIINGLPALVTLIVQFFNATQGDVPVPANQKQAA